MLLRLLAVAYVLTGLVLVLGLIMLGSLVVPFMLWFRLPWAVLPIAAGVLVCVCGVRLWHPTPRLASRLRWTRMTCVLSLWWWLVCSARWGSSGGRQSTRVLLVAAGCSADSGCTH